MINENIFVLLGMIEMVEEEVTEEDMEVAMDMFPEHFKSKGYDVFNDNDFFGNNDWSTVDEDSGN